MCLQWQQASPSRHALSKRKAIGRTQPADRGNGTHTGTQPGLLALLQCRLLALQTKQERSCRGIIRRYCCKCSGPLTCQGLYVSSCKQQNKPLTESCIDQRQGGTERLHVPGRVRAALRFRPDAAPPKRLRSRTALAAAVKPASCMLL